MKDDAAEILEQTLEEEKQTDEKLTEIAESIVNAEEASEGDEGNEKTPAKGGANARARSQGETDGEDEEETTARTGGNSRSRSR